MFYLNPRRPNALQGRKRPRATLTPTLVLKDDRPFMAFGTQGGDSQDQWTLQFFLNHTEFGMNLQQSVDAPLVHCLHFPGSFHPRIGYPGRLEAQPRIAPEVIAEFRQLGQMCKSSPTGPTARSCASRPPHQRDPPRRRLGQWQCGLCVGVVERGGWRRDR